MSNFSYEQEVGIKHYITPEVHGIKGRIKKVISDFIVQEITREGRLISTLDNHEKEYVRKPNRSNRAYTIFTLKKFGVDTIYAIEYLANKLGIDSDLFSFPGIKDNQAISAQQVTVKGDFWKALDAMKDSLPNFRVSNIDFSSEPLRTGDLWGNHFIITIRDIDLGATEIKNRVDRIIELLDTRGGFLNYFGLQRFGTHRPNSHSVGKKLIAADYKGAVEEILIPAFPLETEKALMARKQFEEERDAEKALDVFPKSLYYERILLEHLAGNPDDYLGAIRALPPSIVSIYVYAYQSFLFNEISSLRVDEMGNDLTTPVNGELVSLLDKKNGQVTKVRYIVNKNNQEMLEEYIKLGKACITIPVIGRKVRVNKENPAWNYYQVLFSEEEIERGFLKKPEFNLDINLNGIYRPLALYPSGFNLIEVIPDDIFPGKQACKISFSLPKGTYATMFLRELMKIDNQYL